jgi:hypothetical protein
MLKTLMKVGIAICVVALSLTVYHWDAITGQWKFDQLCKKEGGSTFYAPVERDVGWEVVSNINDEYFRLPFDFHHVSFVRFKDKAGISKDAYKLLGNNGSEDDYSIIYSDDAIRPKYKFSIQQNLLLGDDRITKTVYSIVDIATGGLMATQIAFDYKWTSSDRFLLSASTSKSCDGITTFGEFKNGIFQVRSK